MCDKPFDSAYKGSGKALKLSFKKYGRDNFESFPLCYVDNRSVLSLAEAAVVNDGFIMEHSRQMYNMKSGGIEGSINRQHSSFMKMKMSDPEYKKYWKERCEFYKEHPELSKVRCGKETEEQRQLRYQQTSETNRRIFEYKKKHCPEVLQAENERRRRSVSKSVGLPIVVIDKQNQIKASLGILKRGCLLCEYHDRCQMPCWISILFNQYQCTSCPYYSIAKMIENDDQILKDYINVRGYDIQ